MEASNALNYRGWGIQLYWGGDNSGNALETSNASNYRAWGIPANRAAGVAYLRKAHTIPPKMFAFNCPVSKCSATLASVAAPHPGARQGFRGPNYPRHPTEGSAMGCDMALWRGCSCDTPATHSKLRKEPRRRCSYTLERDKGGW